MSGANIDFEIASGGAKCFGDSVLKPDDTSNLATVIAGDIVSEIIENALDIATQSQDTGVHWKDIKETRSFHNPDACFPQKCLISEPHLHASIVGDTVQNETPKSGLDTADLNAINACKNENNDKPESADMEVKRLLAEMLSPPYQIVNYDNLSPKSGIGDQLEEKSLSSVDHREPPARAIEKKSRVTDLVKNSPQIISEYLMMDELARQNQDEWEESTEQLLQVIELDHVKPGEEKFRVQKDIQPEKVSLPEEGDDDELIHAPTSDENLETVNLGNNAEGGKGDDKRPTNVSIRINPPANDGEVIDPANATSEEDDISLGKQKTKKKKWNFRQKICSFFRKAPKTKDSSTSPRKSF